MKLTSALLKSIASKAPEGVDPFTFVANTLETVETVRVGILKAREHARHELRKYQDAVSWVEAELGRLRALCPHLETVYHPDPAGGSDSSRTCTNCGEDL